MDPSRLTVGVRVSDASPAPAPGRRELVGRHAALVPLDPERDGPALHDASHGSDLKEAIWTYLPYGPFQSPATMTA